MTVSYQGKLWCCEPLKLRSFLDCTPLHACYRSGDLLFWVFFLNLCFVLLQFALYFWIQHLSIAVFTGVDHAITAPRSHPRREEGNKQLQLAQSTCSWVSILWRFALNDHVCPIFSCKNNSFLLLFHRKYVNNGTANHPTAAFCNRATIKWLLTCKREHSFLNTAALLHPSST